MFAPLNFAFNKLAKFSSAADVRPQAWRTVEVVRVALVQRVEDVEDAEEVRVVREAVDVAGPRAEGALSVEVDRVAVPADTWDTRLKDCG